MKTAVYTAVIDPNIPLSEVYPPERQAEIDRCLNENSRLEKYAAWRLLETALCEGLGISSVESVCFSKDIYGKWSCDRCFFSITHSGGVVAVAVSDKPVGVDVEVIKRYREGLEAKILTPAEYTALEGLDRRAAEEYIIRKWSEKESIFKTLDRKGFEPLKIETSEYSVTSEVLDILNKRFVLSVCSKDTEEIMYHFNTQI